MKQLSILVVVVFFFNVLLFPHRQSYLYMYYKMYFCDVRSFSAFIPYNFKERIETLESHLDEARRRLVQMDALKQEKSKLASQLIAQESVMEGLKAERKLWGQELAQQGKMEKKLSDLAYICILRGRRREDIISLAVGCSKSVMKGLKAGVSFTIATQ